MKASERGDQAGRRSSNTMTSLGISPTGSFPSGRTRSPACLGSSSEYGKARTSGSYSRLENTFCPKLGNRYERLSDINFELHKSVVALSDYTRLIRARILYNHLFFSDLDRRLKSALVPGGKYWDVIRHQNYNPRVIDHVVRLPDLASLGPEDFVSKMIATLDDPTVIWERIFRNLSAMAQRALFTVMSLPSEVLLDDVEGAIRSRSPTGFDRNEFRSAVEMVEGTFLQIKEARPGRASKDRIVTMTDPSVHDYLWARLYEDGGELGVLLDSAIFFEQCVVLCQGLSHAMSQQARQFEQVSCEARSGVRVVEHAAFARRALELIGSNSPRLVRVTGDGPGYFDRERPSLERRAAFLASLVAENQTDRRVADSAAQALEACCNEWEAGRGSSREGMDLLRRAKRVETLLPRRALMRAENAFLSLVSGRLEQADDFTALVDLADLNPTLFMPPRRRLHSWKSDFRQFLCHTTEDWTANDFADPNWLGEELEAITHVAECLEEDIGDFVLFAEELIAEISRGDCMTRRWMIGENLTQNLRGNRRGIRRRSRSTLYFGLCAKWGPILSCESDRLSWTSTRFQGRQVCAYNKRPESLERTAGDQC